MIHIPYDTTRLLRSFGMKADFLALGRGGPVWDEADYVFEAGRIPGLQAWHEFRFFWRVVARYEIIHSHFAMMLTETGWEYPLLKKMGRRVVVHYRGCEARNRKVNMALHPEVNICQQCDYNATICTDPVRLNRVRLARKYGDLFLITTPDMKDFVPNAIHFPFFLPQINHHEDYVAAANERSKRNEIKIVHVTGHPGIEGTEEIIKAIDNLKAKGYPINFVFLHIVHHDQVLREIASADLTIGKMKMGYYANAQVESMYLGVPAITWVRPEFMTVELENSGFIFTELKNLEQTLEYYLSHPDALDQKRKIARSSIIDLHGDELLAKRLLKLYADLRKG
jgi:glycosyltransferase involved in cell wall biosynthesis